MTSAQLFQYSPTCHYLHASGKHCSTLHMGLETSWHWSSYPGQSWQTPGPAAPPCPPTAGSRCGSWQSLAGRTSSRELVWCWGSTWCTCPAGWTGTPCTGHCHLCPCQHCRDIVHHPDITGHCILEYRTTSHFPSIWPKHCQCLELFLDPVSQQHCHQDRSWKSQPPLDCIVHQGQHKQWSHILGNSQDSPKLVNCRKLEWMLFLLLQSLESRWHHRIQHNGRESMTSPFDHSDSFQCWLSPESLECSLTWWSCLELEPQWCGDNSRYSYFHLYQRLSVLHCDCDKEPRQEWSTYKRLLAMRAGTPAPATLTPQTCTPPSSCPCWSRPGPPTYPATWPRSQAL